MNSKDLYERREQTLVKHFILQKYLERFAFIVGSYWDVLTYVDCFSGPWNARSDKFEDSSFSIALQELRKAKAALANSAKSRNLKLRCYFLEKNPSAYAKLEEFAKCVTDAAIETRNGTLENSVPEICGFIQQGGKRSFPFIFIDPTGWTGFGMQNIAPLLRLKPGEILINFMTGHIRRFLDSPQEETQASFKALFGSDVFRSKIQGLAKADREDAAVEEYIRNAKNIGGFPYACSAIVLHPEHARTHFHLIYLTRDPKGVEVFKETEKKAMEVQEAARAQAQQRSRIERRGQGELFESKTMHDASHYQALRERYSSKAYEVVLNALQSQRRLLYDDAWSLALSNPMTWESDLKQWVENWRADKRIQVEGWAVRQRVPHRKENNFLVWNEQHITSD